MNIAFKDSIFITDKVASVHKKTIRGFNSYHNLTINCIDGKSHSIRYEIGERDLLDKDFELFKEI